MKIYVAGPYTGKDDFEVASNVTRAIDAGIELIKRGHAPYIPHLTHWVELRQEERGDGLKYEDYLRIDREWLVASDALLFLAPSPGANLELELANQLGLRIFRDLEEILPAQRGEEKIVEVSVMPDGSYEVGWLHDWQHSGPAVG